MGKADKEIALRLGVAHGTIQRFGRIIRQKLRASNRAHCVTIVIHLGLLDVKGDMDIEQVNQNQ